MVQRIFTIHNGKGITKEEVEENKGNFSAVQSGEDNNGVIGKISLEYCKEMDYTFCERPCLTVARTGSAGFVSFQINGCVVGDSAKILLLDENIASTEIYIFLQTILSANRFKYAYGRKVTESKYMNDIIRLPIKLDKTGTPIVDDTHKYSDDGFVPDWEYMEEYIKSLHHKPLTTKNSTSNESLNVSEWKEFFLKDICVISMGNKMDYAKMTFDEPTINFVGRSAENNGVNGVVDYIDGSEPYKAGCITVALGGSLGSSYIQFKDFYTSQNVAVLEFEDSVDIAAKIFITTSIMNECRYKYFPFGRELNTHIRTDFSFYLPVKHNADGSVFIDEEHKYSDKGYVPDWKFMSDYIKSLPYGDRI